MSTRILDGAGVRRLLQATAVAALLAGGAGCVRIDGGAVEISWVVRSPEGQAITDCGCSEGAPGVDGARGPSIAAIRLNLVGWTQGPAGAPIAGATPCEGRAQCRFACQRQTGATPFDIPETQPGEMYEISVTALDAQGNELTAVQTPAPILRAVVKGQPTEVEAFLLVARCGADCMNQSGVCTRP